MNLDEELVNQVDKHETHMIDELPAKIIIWVGFKNKFNYYTRKFIIKVMKKIYFIIWKSYLTN